MSMSLRTSSLPKLMDAPLAARAESVHRSGYKPRQLDNGIVDVLRLTSDHSVQVDTCCRPTPMRQKIRATSSAKFPLTCPGGPDARQLRPNRPMKRRCHVLW